MKSVRRQRRRRSQILHRHYASHNDDGDTTKRKQYIYETKYNLLWMCAREQRSEQRSAPLRIHLAFRVCLRRDVPRCTGVERRAVVVVLLSYRMCLVLVRATRGQKCMRIALAPRHENVVVVSVAEFQMKERDKKKRRRRRWMEWACIYNSRLRPPGRRESGCRPSSRSSTAAGTRPARTWSPDRWASR